MQSNPSVARCWRAAAAVAVLTIVVSTACSNDSDSAAVSSTAPPVVSSSASASSVVTTVGPVESTTVPVESTSTTVSNELTVDALQAALPTPAEVGDSYELADPTPAGEGIALMDDDSLLLCGALNELLYDTPAEGEGESSESARVELGDTTSTRTFSARSTPITDGSDPTSAGEVYDEYLEAVNECPVMTIDILDVGPYVVYPSAERLDGLGDAALRVVFDGEVFTPNDLVSLDIVPVIWRRGQVSSSIIAKSGLGAFFVEVPFDVDDVRRVADLMDARIADLAG